MVHLDDLSLQVSTPTRAVDKDNQTIYRRVGIGTNLDAAEGQKVVVGKSNTRGTDDALILVVTAKVVQ